MKLRYVLILAVFACLILVLPAAADEWTVPLNYSSGVTPIDVAFGTMAGSLDGFDANDVPYPNDPPGGTKHFRFWINDAFFPNLAEDYRPELSLTNDVEIWDLRIESDELITLTWDSSEVPLTVASLILNASGDVDMLQESTVDLAAGTYDDATITAEYDTIPPEITDMRPSADIFDTTIPTGVTISANFTDNVAVDPSTVTLLLNTVDVTSSATVNNENISYTFSADEGSYSVSLNVSDYAGNSDEENWNFNVTYVIIVDIPLSTGWNMISMPVEDPVLTLPDPNPIINTIYFYNTTSKAYDSLNLNNMESGKGYWVAATEGCTLTVQGVPLVGYNAEITHGWNMIGALHESISITSTQTDPSDSMLNFIYGYNTTTKSYEMLNSLSPGEGYWAAAIRDCSLTVALPP